MLSSSYSQQQPPPRIGLLQPSARVGIMKPSATAERKRPAHVGVLLPPGEEAAAAPPPKKPKKPRRKPGEIQKNPKGFPRRPLSAYNYFFQDERARLLKEREQARAQNKQVKGGPSLFSAMGKEIGKRWKDLQDADKQSYNERAARDMDRYQGELAIYREKCRQEELKKKEQEKSGVESPSGGAELKALRPLEDVIFSVTKESAKAKARRESVQEAAKTDELSQSLQSNTAGKAPVTLAGDAKLDVVVALNGCASMLPSIGGARTSKSFVESQAPTDQVRKQDPHEDLNNSLSDFQDCLMEPEILEVADSAKRKQLDSFLSQQQQQPTRQAAAVLNLAGTSNQLPHFGPSDYSNSSSPTMISNNNTLGGGSSEGSSSSTMDARWNQFDIEPWPLKESNLRSALALPPPAVCSSMQQRQQLTGVSRKKTQPKNGLFGAGSFAGLLAQRQQQKGGFDQLNYPSNKLGSLPQQSQRQLMQGTLQHLNPQVNGGSTHEDSWESFFGAPPVPNVPAAASYGTSASGQQQCVGLEQTPTECCIM